MARDYLNEKSNLRFVFPIDGDCINEFDTEVIVAAPEGHDIEICGEKAVFSDGYYRIPMPSADDFYTVDKTTGDKQTVRTFRLKNAVGGYRLSSDDNILFLSDITDHKDDYKSIFENPYLAIYKKAHDLYGAQVHINLFYETDETALACFSSKRKYFNLSMMTDKFKSEFEQNSDWLKLSFHSKSEFPPKPYKFATAQTAREDCEKVHREIIRFAGEKSLSTCTTVHFGEANIEVAKELRKIGYTAMTGYFIPGEVPVAYYAPDNLIEHIFNRDFWFDTQTNILFGRIDLVINQKTLEYNINALKEILKCETRSGFVSIMIHEQYFYEDYINYREDFDKRVLECCKLLYDNGYKGRHISEITASNQLPGINESTETKKCLRCGTDMVDNLNMMVSDGGCFTDVREKGFFKKSLGKVKCSVCPECGYVETYLDKPENVRKLIKK